MNLFNTLSGKPNTNGSWKEPSIIKVEQYSLTNEFDCEFTLEYGDFLLGQHNKFIYVLVPDDYPPEKMEYYYSIGILFINIINVIGTNCILFDNSKIDKEKIHSLLHVFPILAKKILIKKFYNKLKYKNFKKSLYG